MSLLIGLSLQLQALAVTTVHMVFMKHLDLGYVDQVQAVCQDYWENHFNNVIDLAVEMRAAGREWAFTSHPWLIQEYLDGAADCPEGSSRTTSQIKKMTDAIARGDLRWHGLPLIPMAELDDEEFYDFGFSLRDQLNKKFNVTYGAYGGKITDVPGLSRSAIPILARHGIKVVHIGYNHVVKFANLPPVFRWKHPETNTEVIVVQQIGYPCEEDPSGSTWAPIQISGFDHVLAYDVTPENWGGYASWQINGFFDRAQGMFGKDAKVIRSDIDTYATELANAVKKGTVKLPEINGEIGDSWVYGAGAHPWKMSAFREIRRMQKQAIAAGTLNPNDPELSAYNRRLLVVTEHNFGLSVMDWANDLRSGRGWSNKDFEEMKREGGGYQTMMNGWQEQKKFLYPSSKSSPDWAFGKAVRKYLDGQNAPIPIPTPTAQMKVVPTTVNSTHPLRCGNFDISVDWKTGNINWLALASGKQQSWAMPGRELNMFQYKSYSYDDLERWRIQYVTCCIGPADFSKPGIEAYMPKGGTWLPRPDSSTKSPFHYQSNSDGSCHLLQQLSMQDPKAHTDFGAPRQIFLDTNITSTSSSILLNISLTWFNKTSTRLPEALFMGFNPNVRAPAGRAPTAMVDQRSAAEAGWKMEILGSEVDVWSVVPNGTRHLHAMGERVTYRGVDVDTKRPVTAELRTLDAFLVAPGDIEHMLDYDGDSQPDVKGGMHFVLFNNLWGSNFAQWSLDSDMKYRFALNLTRS